MIMTIEDQYAKLEKEKQECESNITLMKDKIKSLSTELKIEPNEDVISKELESVSAQKESSKKELDVALSELESL